MSRKQQTQERIFNDIAGSAKKDRRTSFWIELISDSNKFQDWFKKALAITIEKSVNVLTEKDSPWKKQVKPIDANSRLYGILGAVPLYKEE